VLALHAEIIQLGQTKGQIRDDLPATEIAQVFRQSIFGTLLIWSLYGDGSLLQRMETSFEVLWKGLEPRNLRPGANVVPLFW